MKALLPVSSIRQTLVTHLFIFFFFFSFCLFFWRTIYLLLTSEPLN